MCFKTYVIIDNCLAEMTLVLIFSVKTNNGEEKFISPCRIGKQTETFDINAVACSKVNTRLLSPLVKYPILTRSNSSILPRVTNVWIESVNEESKKNVYLRIVSLYVD